MTSRRDVSRLDDLLRAPAPPFERWPIGSLPLSARAIRELQRERFFTVADLLRLTAETLSQLVSTDTVQEVASLLARHGCEFPRYVQ